MMMRAPVPLMVGALLLLGGCQNTSELGKPCTLVRKATAAELQEDSSRISRPIKEGELPQARPGESRQDFISFGVGTGCEDLICVRDGWYEPSGVSPDDNAIGYCTRACVQGEASSCAVLLGPSEVVPGVRERMSCRPLLLDQQQLDLLRADNPALYRQTFGDNTSPYYCSGGPPANSGG